MTDTKKRSAGEACAHNPFTALICLALAALMALKAGGIYLESSMYLVGTYGGDGYLNQLYTDVSQMAGYAKPELRGTDSLLEKTLEERMERWVYLNDLAERIERQKTGGDG